MINMEAVLKFDIKSVIKSDIKFDISSKLTTWIGHKVVIIKNMFVMYVYYKSSPVSLVLEFEIWRLNDG